MTVVIRISDETERRLEDKARATGVDLPTFILRLLEAEAKRPTLLELSGEVPESVKRMNLSGDGPSDRREEENHAAGAAPRGLGDLDRALTAVQKLRDYDYNAQREQDVCDIRDAQGPLPRSW